MLLRCGEITISEPNELKLNCEDQKKGRKGQKIQTASQSKQTQVNIIQDNSIHVETRNKFVLSVLTLVYAYAWVVSQGSPE